MEPKRLHVDKMCLKELLHPVLKDRKYNKFI